MSSIKSSSEHLTLNADGASKDIKFQANGVEKVIVKSDGSVGVGTSSPEGKIEINDGSYAKMVLDVTGSKAFIQTSKWDGTNPGRDLVIQTKQSDGETARFLADGGITFNGDTAAANALDDYEEGTFTASITSTAATFTPNNTTGYYTKVGNLVTISYVMYMAGAPSGTFTNTVSLQGLPFTSSQAATITWGHHRWTEFPSSTTDIGIQLDANATQLRFYARTGISELSLLTGTVFKRNGSGLWLTGHYYTNA
jgi:hypothetical protein